MIEGSSECTQCPMAGRFQQEQGHDVVYRGLRTALLTFEWRLPGQTPGLEPRSRGFFRPGCLLCRPERAFGPYLQVEKSSKRIFIRYLQVLDSAAFSVLVMRENCLLRAKVTYECRSED